MSGFTLTSLIAAIAFVSIGGMLVRRACAAWAAGHAVTDEDDVIRRRQQPVQFHLFVAVQFVFGCVFALGGVLLFIASVFPWSK